MLLMQHHLLAQRWPLNGPGLDLSRGGEGQPQTVLRGPMSELDVRLAHDAVLLQRKSAGQEGLAHTCGGRRVTGETLDTTTAGSILLSSAPAS